MPVDSRERWAKWWGEAWVDAHTSWKLQFCAHVGLPLAACEQPARRRPQAFMRCVGIAPRDPPEPDVNTLEWLALEAWQRQLALALASEICSPHPATSTVGNAAHSQWCRSVAKALRPGLWLPPGTVDAAQLLGIWLGPRCWARIRLAWPRQIGDEPCVPVDSRMHSRLQTLWSAVLWRAANH